MQRLNAIDLFELNGEISPMVPDSLKATINDNPERIAEVARTILDKVSLLLGLPIN